MNDQLQDFARKQIKEGLAKLPEGWILLFKKMYSHKNLEWSIEKVVDNMPEDKLDLAMQQVTNSLIKISKSAGTN